MPYESQSEAARFVSGYGIRSMYVFLNFPILRMTESDSRNTIAGSEQLVMRHGYSSPIVRERQLLAVLGPTPGAYIRLR